MTNKNPESKKKKSFWITVPGIITALAALITALTGLIAIMPGPGSNGEGNDVGDESPRSNTVILTPRFPPRTSTTPGTGEVLVSSGDPSDAGAIVYVDHNPEGLLARQGDSALYLIHSMPPGNYAIEVRKNGATFNTGVKVEANRRSTVRVVFR